MKGKKPKALLLLSLFLTTSCSGEGPNIKFNDKRDTESYNSSIAERMKASTWNSSVSFLKAFSGTNIFSPLSLFDLSAIMSNLVADADSTKLLSSIGYTSIDTLNSDMNAYRDYFNFINELEDGNIYRSRMANLLSIPNRYDYNKNAATMEERYQLALLKNGTKKELDEEISFIKDATFEQFSERWSEDGYVSLSSSIAYEANFNAKINAVKVDFAGKSVDGFTTTAYYNYANEETFEAVSLPLQNESIVFYLPKEGVSIDSILTKENLSSVHSKMQSTVIELKVPSLKLAEKTDLTEPKVEGQSIKEADAILEMGPLTKILNEAAIKVTPKPSSVIQNIDFSLDANGVKAAASTTVYYPTSPAPESPIQFHVNRPFYFALVDSYSNPLFVGRIITL